MLSDVQQYDTRQARKGGIFMIHQNTLRYGLKSVRYAGAKGWNNIPFNFKQSLP